MRIVTSFRWLLVGMVASLVGCSGSAVSNSTPCHPCSTPVPAIATTQVVPPTVATNNPNSEQTFATKADTKVEKPLPYALSSTEVRVVHSELTGKDHQIIIGLPPSFQKEPKRHYPVLYLLDGQWDFPLIQTLSGGLRFDQVMPEMLIVGLSYAGTEPNYDALRADDYVPTRAKDHEGKLVGGGGSKFLEFLEKSVIPLAESEYRAEPTQRVLSGSSYGGLFTLFALFEKPELFQAYIAISPAAAWDNDYLAKRERDFRKLHPKLERRVWLSIGDSEWPGYVKAAQTFFRQFETSRYQGIALKVHTVAGERHAGVKPEAYNRALRFITAPWLPLPAK